MRENADIVKLHADNCEKKWDFGMRQTTEIMCTGARALTIPRQREEVVKHKQTFHQREEFISSGKRNSVLC